MGRRLVYSPDGELYSIVPRTLKLPQAAEDVLRALTDLGRKGDEVGVKDWVIADYLDSVGKHHSMRYVQKGLKILQDMGLIFRETVRTITRGGVEVYRKIRILLRYRESREKARKVKPGAGLPPKNFTHDIARPCAIHPHAGAVSSLSEVTSQEKHAAVGGEGDGTPPPPAVGEPERPGDALAAIMAAAEAARAAQAASTPPRPADPPSAPGVAPREVLRAKLRADVEAYRRMAEGGDNVAAVELPFVVARLEQFERKFPPAADPPGVGSAGESGGPPA